MTTSDVYNKSLYIYALAQQSCALILAMSLGVTNTYLPCPPCPPCPFCADIK